MFAECRTLQFRLSAAIAMAAVTERKTIIPQRYFLKIRMYAASTLLLRLSSGVGSDFEQTIKNMNEMLAKAIITKAIESFLGQVGAAKFGVDLLDFHAESRTGILALNSE